MRSIRLPGSGCFEATYPIAAWEEVPCVTGPPIPFIPAHGLPPGVVGNGTDFMAKVPTGITRSDGYFPKVTGLASETDSLIGNNSFTFQLNTQVFQNAATAALCVGAEYPSECSGWQQFVFANTSYSNYTSAILMQYWLINYGANQCPHNWNAFGGDCYTNSPMTGINTTIINAMDNLMLSGAWLPGNPQSDEVYLDTSPVGAGATHIHAINSPSIFDLGANGNWTQAEFNVFGYSNGSEANFNAGTTALVQLVTYTGLGPLSPVPGMCWPYGTTGETSNLSLVGGCCPAITGVSFTESNQAGATAKFCPAVFQSVMEIIQDN